MASAIRPHTRCAGEGIIRGDDRHRSPPPSTCFAQEGKHYVATTIFPFVISIIVCCVNTIIYA